MPYRTHIQDSALLGFFNHVEEQIGEVEMPEMVDRVGHLNSQLTDGPLIQN